LKTAFTEIEKLVRLRADAARKMVARAVRAGRLVSLQDTPVLCVDCEKNRATSYDHRDYAKPLQVEPVCRRCNKIRGAARNHFFSGQQRGRLLRVTCSCGYNIRVTKKWLTLKGPPICPCGYRMSLAAMERFSLIPAKECYPPQRELF
jgi:hypothetical protein